MKLSAENPPAPKDVLLAMFHAAVRAAAPENIVAHLPSAPTGRVLVLGAGKASAAMAAAVERAWPSVEMSGLVVTRYGHGAACERIEVVEAGHPVPDAQGQRAAERMLELARAAGPDDLVLALISGGGSSLLVKPAPGLSLDDKREVTRQLLACGATIQELNCVRKHLSGIKGGRLALAAAPAKVLTFVISDVPGDDPSMVASGPTLGDTTTSTQALAIVDRYRLNVPESVRRHLTGALVSPCTLDALASRCAIVAHPQMSLDAAAAAARALGAEPIILGDDIQGEAREVAASMARMTLDHVRSPGGRSSRRVFLSGGETTVTVRAPGRGGRNSEFLLALTIALGSTPGISAIACDTDGIDGSEDNAGAVMDPSSLRRAAELGLDPQEFLFENDSYSLFQALGDLVTTGPTRTNVNDFRAILVEIDPS
ncbi:hydroxypyruvate reductase [Caulobacter sp. Root487D2Y]|uniref:glycerate kinase type-2 family protein n=1 Tax=Caulobacter sp. Root487D2Y TaxID=1736547 RepID=UPI0006F4A289|nr:glycerate kinase [Caulobacter sp. Root487D2Y]KQY32967.1 hydroxypyruvate reductase [Caulobacter sp. Root487D2Y]